MIKAYSLEEFLSLELPPVRFLPSKIRGIDLITGGYMIGDLTVFCGSTGHGKSIVSLASAYCMGIDTEVLYLSCENNILDDLDRIKSFHSKYFIDAKTSHFHIVCMNNSKVDMKEIEALIEEYKCQALFVDSIDFTKDESEDGAESYQNFGKYATALRNLAIKYDMAVITTVQMNRGATGKTFAEIHNGYIADSNKINTIAHDEWYIDASNNWAIKSLKNRGKVKISNPELRAFCMATTNNRELDIRNVWGNSPIGVPDLLKEIKKYE